MQQLPEQVRPVVMAEAASVRRHASSKSKHDAPDMYAKQLAPSWV